ncbi:MAG: N-acetyltransferase [Spirochaetaceae bacterium]|jgi:predicted N-acetyltransferase YhbS|nr:N-acetyltransferase [Spirochaetaceae bacterium]
METITVRPETPDDYFTVECVVREAFLDAPHADGTEALLARKLRDRPSFVRSLDYVAVIEGAVAGNIMYSMCDIIGATGERWEALTLAPLSVLPRFQRRGVGSLLVRYTLDAARKAGFRAVLLYGHETYYPRFGFSPAARYGITTAGGDNFDAFMALPLHDGALDGVRGRYIYDAVFDE